MSAGWPNLHRFHFYVHIIGSQVLISKGPVIRADDIGDHGMSDFIGIQRETRLPVGTEAPVNVCQHCPCSQTSCNHHNGCEFGNCFHNILPETSELNANDNH
ncbi:hypothetical protein CBW22_25660 [Pantoea sp. VS1]|nr:hypothetical protein CBW22_25660 [Pantoea sp. VS1]